MTSAKAVPTVSHGWMNMILDAAAHGGISPAVLARAAGFQPAVYAAARCPLPVCIATWEAAARLTGDPHFGLHAGSQLRPLHLNLVSHALHGSRTVGEALAQAQRYLPLVSDGGTIETRRADPQQHARGSSDDEFEIRYLPLTHGWQYSHHQIDAALLAVRQMLGWLLGDDATPRRATLAHALDAPAEYRKAFACPVRGKARHNALYYPVALLGQPTGADSISVARATARADRLLAGLRESSWSARCERLLAASLAMGDVSRARVAGELSISQRTLQRRLADESHDFQTLLANLRRDLACEYLENGVRPAETARLLGYSEPAAFHRAFVAWLGVTPGAYASRPAAMRRAIN